MPNNCPFCLNNDDDLIFASDNLFFAIYNRAPILPGHSLIVPQRHVESLEALNQKELSAMLVFTRRVNDILKKAFNHDGFNWTIQDGAAAGQTVNHMHLHIIPRKTGDLPEPGDWYPLLQKSGEGIIDSLYRPRHSPKELKQIAAFLRNQ